MNISFQHRCLIGVLVTVCLLAQVSCGGGGDEPAAPPPASQPRAAVSVSGDAHPPMAPPAALPSTPPATGDDLAARFRQAAELARTGLYERALPVYEGILDDHPDHVPSLVNAARIHFIRGRTEQAIDLLARANTAEPGNPRTLGYLGMAEVKAGQLEQALVHLEGALILDPARIDVGNEKGAVHLQLEQYEEAEAAWRQVLEHDPDNMMARTGLDQIRLLSSPGEGDAPRP